jgi:hypothetical protein
MKLARSADKRLCSSAIDMPANLGGRGQSRVARPARGKAPVSAKETRASRVL